MILREYSVCSGFPCGTVSSIQERKGDSFLISASLAKLQQKSLFSRFRRQNGYQDRSPRLPPFFSASFREGRVALSVGHPRGTHSRYVIGCCLIPLGISGVKNNSRRITYGIGCVWRMPSLSPLSSLVIHWYSLVYRRCTAFWLFKPFVSSPLAKTLRNGFFFGQDMIEKIALQGRYCYQAKIKVTVFFFFFFKKTITNTEK